MAGRTAALALVTAVLAPPWPAARGADAPAAADGFTVVVERVDGGTAQGTLVAVTADEVRLADGPGAIPVADVRRVVRGETAAAVPDAVVVELADGSRIAADDVTLTSGKASLRRGRETAEIPAAAVRSISFRRPDDGRPWQDALPDRPESDLVVVGDGAARECVACAIEAVTAEAVTVLLDGERIPVARGRVVGLAWLREPAAPGGVRVNVAGGMLAADDVAWTPEALVLDGDVRIPAAWLRTIDYAAGRTVRLAGVEPETTTVEPPFAGLDAIAGVARFLEPRTVASDPAAAARDLVVRPRTVVTWRVPARSRRFRTGLAAAAWGTATGRSDVSLSVDGREVGRATVGAGVPRPDAALEADVSGAVRLTLTVEVATDGGLGCPVRLVDPVVER